MFKKNIISYTYFLCLLFIGVSTFCFTDTAAYASSVHPNEYDDCHGKDGDATPACIRVHGNGPTITGIESYAILPWSKSDTIVIICLVHTDIGIIANTQNIIPTYGSYGKYNAKIITGDLNNTYSAGNIVACDWLDMTSHDQYVTVPVTLQSNN